MFILRSGKDACSQSNDTLEEDITEKPVRSPPTIAPLIAIWGVLVIFFGDVIMTSNRFVLAKPFPRTCRLKSDNLKCACPNAFIVSFF